MTSAEEANRDADKAFLRACQKNELGNAQQLHKLRPDVLKAESASKGYGPMHWAAMGGSMEVIEWLDQLRVDPEARSSKSGVSPIEVALEYKRLAAARRLQQLRDKRRKDPDGSIAAAEAQARAEMEAEHARAKAEAEAREAKQRAAAKAAAEEADKRHKADAAAALANANREAAGQALEAGQRALSNGDIGKAVRLLRKAHSLDPENQEIVGALQDADREMAAIQKEQQAEQAAAKRDAADSQKMWNTGPSPSGPQPTPSPPLPKASMPKKSGGVRTPASRSAAAPPPAPPSQPSSSSSNSSSARPAPTPPPPQYYHSEPQPGSSSSDADGEGSSGGSSNILMRALAFILQLLMFVVLLFVKAASLIYLDKLASKLIRLPQDGYYWFCGFCGRRYDAMLPDPTSQENLSYLFYYWRARLRWPFRLVGVFIALLLAWRFPWQAYALFILGAAGFVTFFAPQLPYVAALKQEVVGAICAFVTLLCYLLPYTTAYTLGLGLWGLLTYGSWQMGAGVAALLLLFYFLPTTALCLLAFAAWFLFFVILPRICLFATEFSIGTYYFPFNW